MRENPEVRKQSILLAAVKLAKKGNYKDIRREDVAMEAGVSAGLVSRYFETIDDLKDSVVGHAIQNDIVNIIAQAIVYKHKLTRRLPNSRKTTILHAFVTG